MTDEAKVEWEDVLGDGWEGEVEESAWVPVNLAATAGEAVPIVLAQRPGDVAALAEENKWLTANGGTAWMCPSGEPTPEENERWRQCAKDEEGAVEFWIVEVVEDESDGEEG